MAFCQRLEGEEALESNLSIFYILHPLTGVPGVHSCGNAFEDFGLIDWVLADHDSLA